MRKLMLGAVLAGVCSTASILPAASYELHLRDSENLGTGTTAGQLSGLTWAGGNQWLVAADARNEILPLTVTLAADGSMSSVVKQSKFELGGTDLDYEGVAIASNGKLLVSYEETPGINVFNAGAFTSAPASSLPVPNVFANRRGNLGLEALTIQSGTGNVFTANEEALTVDGGESTSSVGSVVRIQTFTPNSGSYTAGDQFAYQLDPIHGNNSGGATSDPRSGLSDLVALPDGKLLTLERSVYWVRVSGVDLPNFQTRIYLVEPATSSTISNPSASLTSQSFDTMDKTLLWTGSADNLEGLALGPATANGYSILGVTDNQDSTLLNGRLFAFELVSVPEPGGAALLTILGLALTRRSRRT